LFFNNKMSLVKYGSPTTLKRGLFSALLGPEGLEMREFSQSDSVARNRAAESAIFGSHNQSCKRPGGYDG
jgi:hypothetical protein